MIAERWRGIDGLDDITAEIARMRGHETHAANSRYLRHGQKQLRKRQPPARGVAIGIHRLAQELNLRVAHLRKLAHFPQNGIAGAAAFRSARIRHHAVRASLIAALDDCEISAEGMVAPRQFRFESFVGISFQAGDAAFAVLQPRQQQRKFAITGRTAHQAHPRSALENLVALLLRHAAEHADHFAGIAAEIIFRVELA